MVKSFVHCRPTLAWPVLMPAAPVKEKAGENGFHKFSHLQAGHILRSLFRCTGCKPGYHLLPDLGTCVTTCRSSEFSSSNATCLSCHATCGECYGPGSNHCLTCPPNHSLASGANSNAGAGANSNAPTRFLPSLLSTRPTQGDFCTFSDGSWWVLVVSGGSLWFLTNRRWLYHFLSSFQQP